MPKVYVDREVLEKLEWIADEFTGVTGGRCRICGGYRRGVGLHDGEFAGHSSDCELGIALSRKKSVRAPRGERPRPLDKRPNKFLDGMALEEWTLDLHKDVFDEWEFSLECENDFSFWEWLECHEPDVLSEFKKSFKIMGIGAIQDGAK